VSPRTFATFLNSHSPSRDPQPLRFFAVLQVQQRVGAACDGVHASAKNGSLFFPFVSCATAAVSRGAVFVPKLCSAVVVWCGGVCRGLGGSGPRSISLAKGCRLS